MTEGFVFNIQKFSTEDGPGIRTTVFMKSCPLRCAWCHNPEAFKRKAEVVWYDVRCMGDRACVQECSTSALTMGPDGICIDRRTCETCGRCTDVCPTGALEVIGREYSVDELLHEVCKDEVFYKTSGGGVTISGGEPLVQPRFVSAFASRGKRAGLHVALDTCGHVPWEHYERVLPSVDLVLFDLKIMDRQRHKMATGVDNARILENASKLANAKKPMWIRTPLIPSYTADDENLKEIGAFIQGELPTVERWDLLAYSNLGAAKYRRFGLSYALGDVALLTKPQLERAVSIAKPFAPKVVGSGATRADS